MFLSLIGKLRSISKANDKSRWRNKLWIRDMCGKASMKKRTHMHS